MIYFDLKIGEMEYVSEIFENFLYLLVIVLTQINFQENMTCNNPDLGYGNGLLRIPPTLLENPRVPSFSTKLLDR